MNKNVMAQKGRGGGKSKEYLASILLETLYGKDKDVCARHGVSLRSLYNYRRQLAEDQELRDLLSEKKRLYDTMWAAELPTTLRRGIQLMNECFEAVSEDPNIKKSPEFLHALAGALKVLAQVYYVGAVFDQRFGDSSRGKGLFGPDPDPSPYSN